MNGGILEISTQGLLYGFLPALVVLAIMWRWQAGAGTAVYAMLRMLVQLFLIGYVLIYIFDSDNFWIIRIARHQRDRLTFKVNSVCIVNNMHTFIK